MGFINRLFGSGKSLDEKSLSAFHILEKELNVYTNNKPRYTQLISLYEKQINLLEMHRYNLRKQRKKLKVYRARLLRIGKESKYKSKKKQK